MADRVIHIGLDFQVKKEGLRQVEAALDHLQNLKGRDLLDLDPRRNLKELGHDIMDINNSATKVGEVLNKAFNQKLGTMNVSIMKRELQTLDLGKIKTDFEKAGLAGHKAFYGLTTDLLSTNLQLKQTHTLLDKMGETMGNTIKWGISSSVMNQITGSVQQAYYYVKDLDQSLNDIRIVTNKSATEMDKFAVKANNAAKALSKSTKDYTKASLIYYQQGLGDQDVAARTETTLKTANVTGQQASAVSEQLTAIWNGYKVSAAESELYIDKVAAVAAATASDLEELSTGMSKVASAANAMGVDIDKLNGMLSTVISVTRQAPESAGTAFKTIFARFEDLELGKKDEDGVRLGEVSSSLDKMGVHVLNAKGQLRDLGEVIEEVGKKWNTGEWSDSEQTALAIDLAGKRQYNNLLALFDNWDMYEDAVGISEEAFGTLENQNQIYEESTEAHLARMKTSWEDFYDSLIDTDVVNGFADIMGGIGSIFADFIDSIGGGTHAFAALGAMATTVFSKQIGKGLATTITNIENAQKNLQNIQAGKEVRAILEAKGLEAGNLGEGFNSLVSIAGDTDLGRRYFTEEQLKIRQESLGSLGGLYAQQESLVNKRNTMRDIRNELPESLLQDFGITNLTDPSNKKEFYTQLKTAQKEVQQSLELIQNLPQADEIKAEIEKDYKQTQKQKNKSTKEKDGAFLERTKNKIKNIDIDSLNLDEQETNRLKEKQKKLLENNFDNSQNKKGLKDSYKESEKFLQEISKKEQEILKNSEKIKGASKQNLQSLFKWLEKNLDLDEELQKVNGEIDKVVDNLTEMKKGALRAQQMEGFTKMAGGIAEVISGGDQLINVFERLSDDSLSPWEKFTTGALGLYSALGFVIRGLSDAKEGFSMMKEASKGLKEIADGSMAQKIKNIILTKLESKEVKKNTKETDKNTKAKKRSIKVQDKQNRTKIKGVFIQEGENLKRYKKSGPTSPVPKVESKIVGVLTKLKALVLAHPFIALATVMTAVGIGFAIAAKKANSLTQKLKEQQKTTQSLKQSYQETAAGLDQFQNQVKDFREGQKALDDLKGKQEEYNNALKESNNQAKELIEKYGLIKNKDWEIKFGKIDIKESALEDIENTKRKEAGSALKTLSVSQVKEAQLEYKKKQQDLLKGYSAEPAGGLAQNATTFHEFSESQNKQIEKIVEEIANEKEQNGGVDLTSQDIQAILESQKSNLDKEVFEALSIEDNQAALNKLTDAFLEAQGKIKEGSENAVKGFFQENEKYDKMLRDAATDEKGNFDQARYDQMLEALSKGINIEEVEKEIQNAQVYTADTKGLMDGETAASKKQRRLEYAAKQNGVDVDLLTISADNANKVVYKNGDELEKTGVENLSDAQIKANVKNDEIADETLRTAIEQANEVSNIGTLVAKIADMDMDELNKASEEPRSLLNSYQEAKEEPKIEEDRILRYMNSDEEAVDFAKQLNENNFQGKVDLIKDRFDMNLSGASEEYLHTFINELIQTLNSGLFEKKEKEEREKANTEGEAEAKELGIDIEEFKAERDILKQNNKELKDNAKLVNDLAIANKRFERGQKNLTDNLKEFDKAMKGTKDRTMSMSQAIPKIKDAFQDMFNLTNKEMKALPNDFFRKNWDLIKKGAQGSKKAITQLRKEIGKLTAKDIIMNLDIEGVDEVWNQANGLINDIHKNTKDDFEFGVALDSKKEKALYGSIQKLVSFLATECGMGEKSIRDMVSALGYDIEIDYKKAEVKVPKGVGSGDLIGEGVKAITESVSFPVVKVVSRNDNDYTPSGNESPSGSGGSGGSGGGGSSSPESVQSFSAQDPEIDRYHEIDTALKDIENDLTKISHLKDLAFGKDKLKLLEDEAKLLKKQNDLLIEKRDIAGKERNRIRNKLKEKSKGKVKYDEDGQVSNYEELLKRRRESLVNQEEKIRSLRKRAKEHPKDRKKINKRIKRLDKKYQKDAKFFENYKKLMDRNDEISVEVIPELDDQKLQNEIAIAETRLEGFNYKIQLGLDTNDIIKQYRDLVKTMTDKDDISALFRQDIEAAKEIAGQNKNKSNIDLYLEKYKVAQERFKAPTSSRENKEQAYQDMKDAYSSLIGEAQELKGIIDSILAAPQQLLAEVQKDFQYFVSQYEYINSVYEHQKQMLKLTTTKNDWETSLEKEQAILDKQLSVAKTKYNSYLEEIAFLENAYILEKDEDKKREINKQIQEAKRNAAKTLEDILNLVNAQFKIALDKAGKDFEKALLGDLYENIKEGWDLANKSQKDYYDKIEQGFGIDELGKKYQEALDASDSLYAQEKITEMMNQQLEMLREKDKLSKYELERANKMFDLMLKEIALKEAQENKTKMRLRRDSQGNYSYQYVADGDAIDKAQAEYDKAQKDLYTFDKKQTETTLNDAAKLVEEANKAITKAAEEGRSEDIPQIIEWYQGLISSKAQDANLAYQNLVGDASKLGVSEEELKKMIPFLNTELAKNIFDLAGDPTKIGKELQNLSKDIETAIKKKEEEDKEALGKDSEGNDKTPSIEETAKAISETLTDAAKDLKNIYNTINSELPLFQKQLNLLLTRLGVSEKELADLNLDENKNPDTNTGGGTSTTPPATDPNPPATDPKPKPQLTPKQKAEQEKREYEGAYRAAQDSHFRKFLQQEGLWEKWQKSDKKDRKEFLKDHKKFNKWENYRDSHLGRSQYRTTDDLFKRFLITQDILIKDWEEYQAKKKNNGKKITEVRENFIKEKKPKKGEAIWEEWRKYFKERNQDLLFGHASVSMDTGGYTGKWGKEGKLALLHEKELVLNQTDTKNLLDSLSILKSLDSALLKEIGRGLTFNSQSFDRGFFNRGPETFKQNVHIEASFPGVRDAREIENALNNLTSVASQYALEVKH